MGTIARVLFAGAIAVACLTPAAATEEDVYGHAKALYAQRDWQACIEAFAPFLKTDPADAVALLHTGKATLHLETFPEAIPFFERLTEAAPKDPDAWWWLGSALGLSASEASIFKAKGYVGRMKAALATALELDEDHAGARIAMVQFYCEAPFFVGGSMRKARGEAERTAGIDAVSGDVAWGIYSFFDGEYEDALKRLEAARDGETERGMAYVFLGRCYAQLGREKEAIEVLEYVLTLDEGASFARKELAKLR